MATADARASPWSLPQRQARTNQLLAEHHELVFRYAYRQTGCRNSAEDITQEVFLRVFKSIEQLRDPLAERGWLLAITRNEFARWCRSLAAQRTTPTALDVADNANGEQDLERRDWVQAAIEQLAPEFRAVVLMFYFEEMTYMEIADAVQIPIGTVMSRLNRAKNHLKRCLDAIALPQ